VEGAHPSGRHHPVHDQLTAVEVARPLVADRRRLGNGSLDVAEIDTFEAQIRDPRSGPARRRRRPMSTAPRPRSSAAPMTATDEAFAHFHIGQLTQE
jgi:hypothetical protein